MSKVTKKDLQHQINGLAAEASTRHNSIMRIHRALASIGVDIFSDDFDLTEPEPRLKQLDQSVFDGLDEKWRWAATDRNGKAFLFSRKPTASNIEWYAQSVFDYEKIGDNYDTSNWQNSLIERDVAKELAEVDLSSELTGSELCKAMLARGDGYVVCLVSNVADSHAIKNREHTTLIEQWVERDGFYNYRSQNWGHAVPANPATNEPLTASEAGF
ncbi:hypothetical protein Q8P09_12400 [Psychrobacter faecalis]|uniref:Uncharacterized protein n=1 Tax=Psychrobacter faecalis TaxID=180588 RepID=A0ABT9HJB8_9GAMM|nr:hypothetical protein [Psychrobacter faecalis]MDP4545876.1 hypothetical protein [Psychrobacter faecalis]